MPVTLKDIAERAGVTSATVSMVINNKPNISEATRRKVLKIAKELNYYPNVIARGLATRKSNSIGVIVPNLASSFVVRILQGIKTPTAMSITRSRCTTPWGKRKTSRSCFSAWRASAGSTVPSSSAPPCPRRT